MEIDYAGVGMKAGLEIHQQLDTSKLFCSCPSVLRSGEAKGEVVRSLNLVAGESGEIDAAAVHEKSKNKNYVYQFFDTNCLVELDEEPPHEINEEALMITLQIAHLLKAKIFPVTQVMRKIVVDGSNTSGFQRTVLIAYDGYVETSLGRVGIESIALEEDSARKDRDDDSSITYKLDRLGIPLVEITTKPELKTAEQVKETALKIGEILRACKVKRGIGTIRQDLNISVRGSKRVEIKGFQDAKMMVRTIENEVLRQLECVKNKTCRSEVRRATPDGKSEFLRPMPGAARMYPETDIPLLKISKKMIDDAKKNLPKLASENKSYLKDFGLNDELISLVLKAGRVEDFKTLTKSCDDYSLIAKSLTLFQKELAKKESLSQEEISKKLDIHVLEAILERVGKDISSGDVKMVMQKILQGKSLDEALKISGLDVEGEVKRVLEEKPGLSQGAYMGLLMAKLGREVSGSKIMEALKKQMAVSS